MRITNVGSELNNSTCRSLSLFAAPRFGSFRVVRLFAIHFAVHSVNRWYLLGGHPYVLFAAA